MNFMMPGGSAGHCRGALALLTLNLGLKQSENLVYLVLVALASPPPGWFQEGRTPRSHGPGDSRTQTTKGYKTVTA